MSKIVPLACSAIVLVAFLSPPGFSTWFLSSQSKNHSENKSLTSQEELRTFQISPGLRIELVAAEPQIESPVAMAFDENGKLWVVEMRDYPNGPPKGEPPLGRIRVLQDPNADGYYETSTIFAENLNFANGLLPWQGGVIVTAAPNILFLQDANRDGKADKQVVLYEGFAEQNPQLRVSHPNLGIDNWIYVANGLRGGSILRKGQPKSQAINLRGKDFRFDLIHNRHEAITGMGQFGLTFDDWGNRFVCDNRHHLRHIVLEDRYLKQNPYLAAPKLIHDPSDCEGGIGGSGGKIYPLSKNWTTSNLHAGTFTAACGVFIYRGDLLPKKYQGCAFTCDPTGNLVHREVLHPRGVTFNALPGEKKKEFMASSHEWFRPVFLSHGPDGALYLIDMYRAVIEHPQFMPPELKNRPDLTWGRNKGRIWRIVPKNHSEEPVRPQLGKATSRELVALLEHANPWYRTTAQRLLLEKQDKSAVKALERLCFHSKTPLAKVHAAYLLNSYEALDMPVIEKLLSDENSNVRKQAILLCESRLTTSPKLQTLVAGLSQDEDPKVRYQVALSLGECQSSAKIAALGRIALSFAKDNWIRTAVAVSAGNQTGKLIDYLLVTTGGIKNIASTGQVALLNELCQVVGSRQNKNEIRDLLGKHLKGKNLVLEMILVDGVAQGLARRGTSLSRYLQQNLPEEKRLQKSIQNVLESASKLALDENKDFTRKLAIRLVAHLPLEDAKEVLQKLRKDPKQSFRLRAIQILSNFNDKEVGTLLLKDLDRNSLRMRREVIAALLQRTNRLPILFRAIEERKINPNEIPLAQVRQLLRHRNKEIRNKASKLLVKTLPADRKKVLAQYSAALKIKGDPRKGKAIFKKNCAICHKIAGIGMDVGPVISDTRTKTLAALLTDILNPNQAIDNDYMSYVVSTKSGKVLTGIIANETSTSLTLKRAENKTDLILRKEVDQILSSGVSLMPEGLEKNISVPEMADLLSFLKNWRYLEGDIPGIGAK